MSVYTNRGLKLRLDTAFVFALIARLSPRYGAFTVFQYVEGAEQSMAFFFDASVILTLWIHPTPLFILFIPPFFATLQMLMKLARWYTPFATMMMPLFRIYAIFRGYGIILTALVASVYISLDWRGVLALFGAYTLSYNILSRIEHIYAWWWQKYKGRALWGSEHSFIYAFQYLAHKLGVNARTIVTNEEKERETTYHALARFIVDYKNVYDRFDDDYITHKLDEKRLAIALIKESETPPSPFRFHFPSMKTLLFVIFSPILISVGFLTSFTIYSIPIGLFLAYAPAWCFRIPFPLGILPFFLIHNTLHICIFRCIFNRIAMHPFFFQRLFVGHHLCFSLLFSVAVTWSMAFTFPPINRYFATYTAQGPNVRILATFSIVSLITYCVFFLAHQKSLIPKQFAIKYPNLFD